MAEDTTKEDLYLLEEHRNASQLTYHIDELRNNLTSFFITFSGLAVAGLTFLLKGEVKVVLFDPSLLIVILLSIIGLIGVAIVAILARLRRAQLEHFRIINNIREHFLNKNKTLWNIVQLSGKTLPMPDQLSGFLNRLSGTYLWLLLIIIVDASLFAAAIYLLTVRAFPLVSPQVGYICSSLTFINFIVLEDKLYFALAVPPPVREY